jgi:RNA polymerase sigma factor (sigma-70 family)
VPGPGGAARSDAGRILGGLQHLPGIGVSPGMDEERVAVERLAPSPARAAAVADGALVDAWQAHRDELYAFLVRTTRDPEVSQDLLAEAYLRLMRELRAGRGPDNVRAWLYQVAANLAVSRGRRLAAALRGLVRVRAAARDSAEAGPEDTYLRQEFRASVLARLASLDPDARAALLMAAEGFSGAEIARAIARLRGGLDDEEAAR